ncbi:GNAT family N-acetyltransferase [Tropicimonas sp. TH_r6]|uniref:GNAT family N-acetyltransferase n=1 Tax=Tropicimonas sp. TH_r6 TaxID=3082085 RepID=UPI002955C6C9|nr:GNAT family N-acetyltransferase [Tropicimonas sp. TH_r6]MDV7143927.1 GNAT family N-acetyltransferase [Tropicimonas sp. TH_r6]
MKITLEPLDKAEIARVMHLELGADQLEFVGQIADMATWDDPREDFHIVLRDGVVVGFFKLDRGYPDSYPFADASELGIRGVLIDRKCQGQGIGAAAMAAIPAYAAARYPEASGLVLTVNCNNPAAQKTYEKAGFRLSEELYLGGRAGPQFILRYPLAGERGQGRETPVAL